MYLCAFTQKQIKKKASTFLYEFFSGKLSDDQVVYFRDLNSNNFVPENVSAISKTEYKKLKDSIENINGAIKITAHNSNAYMYIIRFKNEGKTVKYVCQDIIQAHKIRRIVLYKSTKILNRYIVTS